MKHTPLPVARAARQALVGSLLASASLVSVWAAPIVDAHGNEGYASAAECDAAQAAGTAKAYEPFTG